ncbi:MAG: gliding motility-associated C-terminal domain-containing protein [Bacteroidia bacterium]|nr:gliding motility-associated C-terminal domain-containing protein [Bacteroidia bacterium]
MNRNFYKIFFIFYLVILSGKKFYAQNPAACNNLVNLCTNSAFSFSANSGTGLVAGLNISNPFSNPQAVNVGCMFTNVANPQWLLLNITSSGNLGFSFGAFFSAFPQAGNYDWIMWPYSPNACNDIFNNLLPPVACNWNCTGGGGTGMGTVPPGGNPCNFQPSIPVTQGQQFIILITNPSGVNTPVSFANTGSAGVSCNPILYNNQTACPGQLAIFTGTWVNSSSGSYTLQPGNVVQSNPNFTVSSLVTQVYTVSAQGTNLSSVAIADQTTFTLTINPIIPISVATPTNFCYGSNATFTVSPAGTGTFDVTGPSAPTTSFATTNISYPNVTTSNIGTFTIAASYTNGCTGTQTAQINVAPNHSITVTSNTNTCMNGTVSLTSSMPTATAYAWTGPNSFASSLQNPVLNNMQPVESGVYTVTSNINFNGITCPKSNTVQVSVVTTSAVAVTPNFTLCEGSILNLTSSATGAASYSWNGPASYTSTSQNPSIFGMLPSGAGNYTATASFTNAALTCTTSAVSNVSVVATPAVTMTVPPHICQNATANLSVNATGASAYTWAGPNSFTSSLSNPSIISVQPVASGIYTTTTVFSIGTVSCPIINTASMSVVGTNTVAVTLNFTVCQGSNVNLTSNASGSPTYSWSGPGTYTSSTQNPTLPSVLPIDAGNYNVTAMFTDGVLTCTTGAISNVSVVATSPVTLTIPTHTCQNATINMSIAATGATGFNWAGPNGFTSTNASTNIVNVQPAAAGVYTATATFSIGTVSCPTSNTASMSVVATNTVAVTPNFTLCQGSGLNLTSNATSAVSYSWNGPGGFTSAAQNTLVAGMLPSGAGNYTATAYFTDGVLTCTTSAVSNVSVVATSTVNMSVPQHTCQNANINLSMAATGATGFNWAGPNGFTSTNASTNIVNVQPAATGVYTATATFSIGAVTCSTSNTSSMSVVPTNTVAVTPNFTLCQGASLNLVSNAAGSPTYSWNGPGGFTSATQNTLVVGMLPSGAGNYTSTAYFTDGVLTCTTNAISNVSVVATSTVNMSVPQHTCQNANINLSMAATGATGFNWAGPNGFTSTNASTNIVNVQPIASGIYTATATFFIGAVTCSTSNTSSMSVVPTNTVAVTPNFTLCQGASLNLASNAISAVSYSWNGPGGFTSAAQNTVVPGMLPSGAGNYTSTAYFTDGVLTCTTAGVSNVSVVATPSTTITYSANICQNATENFSASAPGAVSYTWTGPNSFSATGATASIPGIQTNGTGNYTTTTQFAMGTVVCTTTVTNTVSVVGTATVAVTPTSGFTVCAGANVTLNANATGATSYSWNGPGGYTSPNQNPTINGILPSGTGIYTATASFSTAALTCTTSATLNGSVVAIPPLTVTATSSVICALESTTINASGSLNYTWTPATTLNTGNGPTVIATPLVGTTVYSITGQDASGCLKSNTLAIVVNPLPLVTATSNTMCFGTSAVLTANGAIGYTWTPSGSLSSANGTAVTATPASSSIYTVTGVSNKGCLNTATANVHVNPLPVISTNNYTICYGKSANVSVSGANNYTWTPATALSATNLPNVTANPLTTTVYSVTGQDLNGCKQSSVSTVVVNPLPIISITSPSVICNGQSALMTAGGAISYTWSTGAFTTSESVSPNTSTTYSVTGKDANGCINDTSVFLNVLIQPTLTISGSPTVCIGNMITLTATGGTGYSWNTGETTSVINVEPQSNSMYTVSSGTAPCSSSTVFAVTVYTPQSQAPYADPPLITYGSSSVIHANVTGSNPFNWSSSPDISCNNCEANTVSPSGTTVYYVTLTDNQGCVITNSVVVEVDFVCGDVFLPTAFSPNNDGFNDTWCVYSNCVTSMNLQLYNRWGEKVFESNDKKICWDGTHNGTLQNDAVFIYQLTASLANGAKIIKKGNVTLKR